MRTLLACLAVVLLVGCQGPASSTADLPPACQQAADAGMCRAAIQRYYFDASSAECRQFIWGGCGGSVPFETRQDCVQQCLPADNPNKETP